MKKISVLPIVAIFIIATMPGDEFLSVSYCIKGGIAAVLMILAIILLILNKKRLGKEH